MAEDKSSFEVIWATRAVDKLTSMLEDARHAQGNPEWVSAKLEECLTEAIRRLTAAHEDRLHHHLLVPVGKAGYLRANKAMRG